MLLLAIYSHSLRKCFFAEAHVAKTKLLALEHVNFIDWTPRHSRNGVPYVSVFKGLKKKEKKEEGYYYMGKEIFAFFGWHYVFITCLFKMSLVAVKKLEKLQHDFLWMEVKKKVKLTWWKWWCLNNKEKGAWDWKNYGKELGFVW